jgi:phage gp29-like protein
MGLIRQLLLPILAKVSGAKPQGALMRIVQPQARDRWLSSQAREYTPETIETTIRGALSGNLVAHWQMFDLMEGTWYRLQKNLQEVKRAVVSLDWTIQAWAEEGEEPSEEAQRRRRLLSKAIWSMRPKAASDENDFEGLLWNLLDCWGKGFSVQEIDWELVNASTLPRSHAPTIVPRATRWIHPRYYGYPMDREELMLNMREIRQSVGASERRSETTLPPSYASTLHDFLPFPEHKFLVGISKEKAGHPIGGSLLRCLGFWWVVTNFSGEWMLNFAQLFGQPIRWATYDPANKGLLAVICEMLENMGHSGWAAMPAGTALELKEAVKSGADNPQAFLLQFAEKVCDIRILGQTLTSDVGKSGSRALGDVHQAVRGDVIDAVAGKAASILNQQLVPAFCELNFGDTGECPYFAPSRKEARDETAMAQRDEILSRIGLVLPEGYMRERFRVPAPEEGEAVLVPPWQPSPLGPQLGPMDSRAAIQAKDATDQLVENVLEDLTSVQARWLAEVKPFFARLVEAAKDGKLTDQQLIATLEAAQKRMPELFDKLNTQALADALEGAMGAAMVNGAVQGAMKRTRRNINHG